MTEIRKRDRTARSLHRGHFAFMRALMQGMDAQAVWNRYLRLEGEHSDGKKVKSAIAWIRAEFAAAARRHNKPGTARLVLIDVNAFAEPAQLPTLEEFAIAHGLEEFSHAEQAAAYAEAFGTTGGKANRRARLVRHQLDALHWLEGHVAQDPAPSDPVRAWLAPAIADRLHAFGLPTLFALAQRINGMGAGWHTGIPAIGAGKAARIVDWMRIHQASIGVQIGAHATLRRSLLTAHDLAAVVPPATALVPLEKFAVPAHLDGSAGAYRLPRHQCQLTADNDHAAISAWLGSKQPGAPGALSATQRSYRKEAERLLLWSILEARMPISSMSVEDAQDYMRFLEDPPSSWCGPRHHQRWSPLWRPLQGPLDASARAQALTILRNLFTFLNDQGYRHGNPFNAVARPRIPAQQGGHGRTLTFGQVDLLLDQLERLEHTAAQRRARLAVHLLYATGLRRSEMVAAKCGDLELIELTDEDGSPAPCWILTVVGKGQRMREVLVPEGVIEMLKLQLVDFGRDSNPLAAANADAPMLARDDGDELVPMTPGALYKAVKRVFERCAAAAEVTDPANAARLRNASTHWLRHAHASHSVNGRPGLPAIDLRIAKDNLGHDSLDTTLGYVTTARDSRVKAMRNFWRLR